MSDKPIFIDRVTNVTPEWANTVSALVYDIFKAAATKAEALSALGVGTISLQSASNVQIAGGTIDGTTIGLAEAASAKFTRAWVQGVPTDDNEVVNKYYVDSKLLLGVAGLNAMSATVANVNVTVANLVSRMDILEGTHSLQLGTLAVQNADNIAVTGGLLDNVSIGSVVPTLAKFTKAWSSSTPIDDTELTNKLYVDTKTVSGAGFEYSQNSASAVWTINHTLNKKPSVLVQDSAGNTVEGDIAFESNLRVVLTFTNPFSGKAYLN